MSDARFVPARSEVSVSETHVSHDHFFNALLSHGDLY